MILGAIDDDFTGSSDLRLTFPAGKLRTKQYIGLPLLQADHEIEAGMLALKTRTMAVADDIKASIAADGGLREQGCEQILLKNCSMFN